MTLRCKHVQEALVATLEERLEAADVLDHHLDDCDDCSAVRDSLSTVDRQLADLAAIDPPPNLVDSILAEVNARAPKIQLVHSEPATSEPASAQPKARGTWTGRTLAMGSAFAAAAAVALVLLDGAASNEVANGPRTPAVTTSGELAADDRLSRQAFLQERPVDPSDVSGDAPAMDPRALSGLGDDNRLNWRSGKDGDGRDGQLYERLAQDGEGKGKKLAFHLDSLVDANQEQSKVGNLEPLEEGRYQIRLERGPRAYERDQTDLPDKVTTKPVAGNVSGLDDYRRSESTTTLGPATTEDITKNSPINGQQAGQGGKRLDGAAVTGWNDLWSESQTGKFGAKKPPVVAALPKAKPEVEKRQKPTDATRPKFEAGVDVAEVSGRISDRASDFVAERDRHAGVRTVDANGFWSNNYIPGDPRLRLLAARLDSDPAAAALGSLDEGVTPYQQSFDAPKNSALAVSVRGDRRAADGPARSLIQVGLEATKRQPGGRPALNIGVVLDLRDASGDDAETAMRNLLTALRDAKRRGDRFSLTVANRAGGLVLPAKRFRNGPLRVALRSLFAESRDASTGDVLSLEDAVAVATKQVAATDDPNGPLGRSMVLVVTASKASTRVDRALRQLAHDNAVAGIGLSAIGVGANVDDSQLLRWAAAGHGNRRLVLRADDAKTAIANELASAGSVVARAVRVRVKLAPGVKLVEVVGSHRLDAAAAARTRDMERSIDRRVAKARGIEADREEDEDGVKIIIPSFSAGDSHVILLDVIADGPGPLADVVVSYKDLVHLRNGNARSALSLARGRDVNGPFERSVFRNYVGQTIASQLSIAGRLLGAGDVAGASRVVTELDELVSGLSSMRPWLRGEAGFARDVATVKRFNEVLRAGVDNANRAYVANSLSYAAWRKIVPVRSDPK